MISLSFPPPTHFMITKTTHTPDGTLEKRSSNSEREIVDHFSVVKEIYTKSEFQIHSKSFPLFLMKFSSIWICCCFSPGFAIIVPPSLSLLSSATHTNPSIQQCWRWHTGWQSINDRNSYRAREDSTSFSLNMQISSNGGFSPTQPNPKCSLQRVARPADDKRFNLLFAMSSRVNAK